MKYCLEEASKVIAEVASTEEVLSAQEAEKRFAENGRYKLAEAKKDSLLKRFLNRLTDPMIIILAVVIVNELGVGYRMQQSEED